MTHYFLSCRSLTYGQRTQKALERAGITAQLIRSPVSVSTEGCGYLVKIAAQRLPLALEVLRAASLAPLHVYSMDAAGTYREIYA
ncbi:MAG TPA: DUF3343 domain-containing protein [Oscillospiraceae bacterium]|nr:DUF3343 domain-containing protein [Oscillospiraceae bacterium]